MAIKRQRIAAALDGLATYTRGRNLPAPRLRRHRRQGVPVLEAGASMRQYVVENLKYAKTAAAGLYSGLAAIEWTEADVDQLTATVSAICQILLEQ